MGRMRPCLTSLVTLFFLVASPWVRAQSVEMNPGDSRALRLDVSFEPEADFDEGGAFESWQTRLKVPVFGARLREDLILGLQLNYELTTLDTSFPLLDREEMHRLELGSMLVYKSDDSPWTALLGGWVGLATDGSSVTGDDVAVRALAAGGYRFSDRFNLLFGAYYSNDFGDATLFPGLGFMWKVSENWTASLIPPRLRLTYQINDLWSVSAEAYPDGGAWSAESFEGDPALVERKAFRAGVRVERQLGESGSFHFGMGSALGRELRIENENTGRLLFESDIDDGLYFSTGLAFRF
jgi:hypothetical protein